MFLAAIVILCIILGLEQLSNFIKKNDSGGTWTHTDLILVKYSTNLATETETEVTERDALHHY